MQIRCCGTDNAWNNREMMATATLARDMVTKQENFSNTSIAMAEIHPMTIRPITGHPNVMTGRNRRDRKATDRLLRRNSIKVTETITVDRMEVTNRIIIID